MKGDGLSRTTAGTEREATTLYRREVKLLESAAIEMMIVNAIERTGRAMAQHMGERQTPDELLTVKEVAKILKVSLNYANHLVQSGIIPGLKMNGMKVRRRALEAWMAAMEGQDLSDPAQPVPIRRPSKSA